MNTNLNNTLDKKSEDLTDFLKTNEDGVFYTGHASILVRLNKKKYLFDYINNTNFYANTNQSYVNMRWERAISGGATTAFGHGTYGQSFARSAQAHDFWAGVGMTYLDSPSTTAEITYQVQASTSAGTIGIGINSTNVNNVFALEIGA